MTTKHRGDKGRIRIRRSKDKSESTHSGKDKSHGEHGGKR